MLGSNNLNLLVYKLAWTRVDNVILKKYKNPNDIYCQLYCQSQVSFTKYLKSKFIIMNLISFITICKWGLSCFSWYVVIFQLISLFMEQINPNVRFNKYFLNKYRDIEFPLIQLKLDPLIKAQAAWLCFDTAYSSYSGIFQSNKKNNNAGSLTKLILSKLIRVNTFMEYLGKKTSYFNCGYQDFITKSNRFY